jgi:hypothetical protein
MKKFFAWFLVVAAVLVYLGWAVEDPVSLMLVGLALVAAAVRVAAVALIVAVVAFVAWRFLSARQREFYAHRRVRFVFFLMVAMAFFIAVGFWLNRYVLPHRYHPMSLVADGLVGLYSLLIAWTLISPSRRKAMMALPVTGVVALLLFLVVALAPAAPQDDGGHRTDPLSTLGYLTWVPAQGGVENSGVVYHDSTRAWAGYNLYGPRNKAAAYLMDNDGNIVHTWERYIEPEDNWNHIELLPNGDLLCLVRQQYLLCLDWDSNIRWLRELRTHHDVAVAPGGEIYALSRSERMVNLHGVRVPILDDQVVVLEPDGTTRETFWLFDVIGEIVPRSRLTGIVRFFLNPDGLRWIARTRAGNSFWLNGSMPADVFHTNTIEVIDRDVDDVFRRGNLIINSRTQNTVTVVDPRTRELLWTWGPEAHLQWPHHATLLDNGHLLIFDNGSQRKWSRIVEMDPQTREIVWEYTAEKRRDFFSYTRGGNQRLPNGNTLITNSDSGHVFEVTTDGEIVWEFLNPEVDEKHESRAAIYRLMRVYDHDAFPCLDRLDAES